MTLPQGYSKSAPARGHAGPVVPPRGPAPAPMARPQAPPNDGPVVERHIELRSLHAALPCTPERAAEDEKILAKFWANEEAMGFPISDGTKEQQRKLMALQGSVPTIAHSRGKRPAGVVVRRDISDSELLRKS